MRIKLEDIIKMYYCCWEDVERTADVLGIHRSTVYRWIQKARTFTYGRLQYTRLKRKSTQPHTIQYALRKEEERAILRLHRSTRFTALKLIHELGLSVSVSTVNRLLRREGCVRQYGYHIRPYYQHTIHMHARNTPGVGYLQMDVKYLTPQLTGLTWTCFEYAVIDIYSRYKDAVILNQLNEDSAILAVTELINRLPFTPVFIQTDNGLEFQEKFHLFVTTRGLHHHYIHKSTPIENAVIERSFRTDEDEFFFFRYKGATDYDDLRAQYASFLTFYNTKRPHLGINLQYPLEVIQLFMSQKS